jgi:MFS family permease
LLCAIQACFFPVLTTIPLHIIAHGTDLGMTPTMAAYVLSTVGACSIAGRLLIGAAVDKLGGRNAYLICFMVLLSSLILLRFNTYTALLFLFAAPYGFAHGGLFTVVSPTIAEYFDMKSHSSVFGSVVFWGTLGGAAGPLIAGQVFDKTGSYNLAFSALIGLVLLGLLLVSRLKKPDTLQTSV